MCRVAVTAALGKCLMSVTICLEYRHVNPDQPGDWRTCLKRENTTSGDETAQCGKALATKPGPGDRACTCPHKNTKEVYLHSKWMFECAETKPGL